MREESVREESVREESVREECEGGECEEGECEEGECEEGECGEESVKKESVRKESVRRESVRMCEGIYGSINSVPTCNDRHTCTRLTGAVATVRLFCCPSSNPPLASLTRHTLLSDWLKSFNKYTNRHISVQYKPNTHNKDGDAFPHYGFKGRSDDAGVSQGKLR